MQIAFLTQTFFFKILAKSLAIQTNSSRIERYWHSYHVFIFSSIQVYPCQSYEHPCWREALQVWTMWKNLHIPTKGKNLSTVISLMYTFNNLSMISSYQYKCIDHSSVQVCLIVGLTTKKLDKYLLKKLPSLTETWHLFKGVSSHHKLFDTRKI